MKSFLRRPRACRCIATGTRYEMTVLEVISKLKNVRISSIQVRFCFQKYATVKLGGIEYSSLLDKASHHYILFADWRVDIFGLPPSRLPEPPSPLISERLRTVQVDYFAHVNYTLTLNDNSTNNEETFATVSWFSPHPKRYMLGHPAQIWCISLFEVTGIYSYIPVSFVISRCVYASIRYEELNECVLVVVDVL